jgi:hypothetical protein
VSRGDAAAWRSFSAPAELRTVSHVMQSVRRLDFQARRAAGGRRERFWRERVLCLARISTPA